MNVPTSKYLSCGVLKYKLVSVVLDFRSHMICKGNVNEREATYPGALKFACYHRQNDSKADSLPSVLSLLQTTR